MVSAVTGAYIVLEPFNILQVYSDRVFARLAIIDVAYAMRCQVCMPILMLRDLIFPVYTMSFQQCEDGLASAYPS